MKLKCPECQQVLDSSFACVNGHQFHSNEGVLLLMKEDFQTQLYEWLESFHDFQKPELPASAFDHLPTSGIPYNKNIWKARQQDISIISSFIREDISVLDIGSWNGWLANYLTKQGCHVTAIDYFVHEENGLKAKNHYPQPNWTSIQMDLENIDLFEGNFDLIIVNRCISYFTNLEKFLNSITSLLSEKGKIIITGINYSKAEKEVDGLTKSKQIFKEKYGKDLLFKNTKGYISAEDLKYIESKGFKLQKYPGLKNRIKPLLNKNVAYYAYFSKTKNK